MVYVRIKFVMLNNGLNVEIIVCGFFLFDELYWIYGGFFFLYLIV